MAEHNAKTPTDGVATLDLRQQSVASIKVVHLLGGQTLIGQILSNSKVGYHGMERPYEILVMASPDDQKVQCTVIKFGSMLGFMPELAVDVVPLNYANMLGIVEPTQKLLEAYMEGLKREANPVTKAEVAALIHPGAAS